MKHRAALSRAFWSVFAVLAGWSWVSAAGGDTAVAAAEVAQRPSLEQSVYYLASEELEGRGVGTEGLNMAAEFIAGNFQSAGLRPFDDFDSYYQSFEMTTAARIGRDTDLTVDGEALSLGEDFTPTTFSAEERFDGAVAFAGYGISSEEHGFDEYAGIDVEGRVAMVMRFEPHTDEGRSRFAGADWSQAATIPVKARTAARHGAVALLLVNPPEYHGEDVLMPFSSRFSDMVSGIPVIHITQETADRILAGGGAEQTLRELQAAIDQTGEPQSIALEEVNVSGNVAMSRTTHAVKNVVGYLPGQGRADEFIVIGAHYDHLGRGGIGSRDPVSGDIHFGADDNASGTSVIIELAHRLAEQGPLERSLIFIAFTAEEWGLVGSQHFVNNPPVPLNSIVAMINLDMVGRVRGDTIYIGGTGTAESFDAIVEAALDESPLTMRRMGRGAFGASDHVSFTMKRIPALFLFTGLHPQYHRPTDTADTINIEGLEQVTDLTAGLVERLAAAERRPEFVEGSGLGGLFRMGDRGGASLGVMPDYAPQEQIRGMRISGVTPGSAADRAGLRGGDVLLRFDDQDIVSVQDLTDVLAAARPDQKVRLLVQRGEEEIELEATLGRRGN
jgi:hypothetical protein